MAVCGLASALVSVM